MDDDLVQVTEQVAAACEEAVLTTAGWFSVDWNDLGEVTIVTRGGTFRFTGEKLEDE